MEAGRNGEREREERDWLEAERRRRRDDERRARQDGRYVVLINAPSMHDPVPPPWADVFPWRRFEAEIQFPDQDDARDSDDFNGMIRRLLGLRTGPRSIRIPRRNFNSLTPFILVPRPRFRSLNEIMYGPAALQDVDYGDESTDEAEAMVNGAEGSEVDMKEEQDDGVGWDWEQEQAGPVDDVEQLQGQGAGDVEQLHAGEDAGQLQLHAAAAEDAEQQPLPYLLAGFNTNVFMDLDNYDGWDWEQEDVAGQAAGDGEHQGAEDAEHEQAAEDADALPHENEFPDHQGGVEQAE